MRHINATKDFTTKNNTSFVGGNYISNMLKANEQNDIGEEVTTY